VQREIQRDPFIFPADYKIEGIVNDSKNKQSKTFKKYKDLLDQENFVKERLKSVKKEKTTVRDFLGTHREGWKYTFKVDRNGEEYELELITHPTWSGTVEVIINLKQGDWIEYNKVIQTTTKRDPEEVGDAIAAFLTEAFKKKWDVKDVGKIIMFAFDRHYQGVLPDMNKKNIAIAYAVHSRDKSKEAKIVLDSDDDIAWVFWLKDPDKYDLKGIDTPTKILGQRAAGKQKERFIRNHIAIEYDVKSKQKRKELEKIFEPKLVKILKDNFSYDELKQIKGIHISYKKGGKLAAGQMMHIDVEPIGKGKSKRLYKISIN